MSKPTRIRTTVRLFYDESKGGLVVGKDDWGSNPQCWLYLEKGSEGEMYDPDDEIEFENHTTTLPEEWYEVI